MGANNKLQATYHGGDYTPSVNDLAGKCINDDTSIRFTPEMFDRAIARIRAEAKAEAWDEGAQAGYYNGYIGDPINPYKEQS